MKKILSFLVGTVVFSYTGAVSANTQKELDSACEQGSSENCILAADAYVKGSNGVLNYTRAIEFYNKACVADPNSNACKEIIFTDSAVTVSLRNISDVSANAQSKLLKSPNEEELKNVFDTLKKECDLNNDNRACAIYGDMLVSGIGCDRNLELGLSVLNQSAAKADLYALSSLGYRYYNGIDVEPNEFKAFRLLNVSCDNDDFGACRMVSSIYRKGLGVGVKKDDLIKIYQQKCDEQKAVSCHKLANIKNASEDEHENEQALELLKMGCDLGGVRSCVELGDMYSNGTIKQRDNEYAFSCYKTACDKNDPIGCLNLGYAYRMGSGIEQDIKLAYKLFHKSCKRGSSQACAVLAQMPRLEDN